MWELARDADPPYTGSRSAFYAGVRRIREAVQRATVEAVVRFEGLPGEYPEGGFERGHANLVLRSTGRPGQSPDSAPGRSRSQS
jgi:hypothetical protein